MSTVEHKVTPLCLNFAVAPKRKPLLRSHPRIRTQLWVLDKAAVDNIQLKVAHVLSTAKTPKPNITKQEQAAINNLWKNSWLLYTLQRDKGNATVILKKADYNHKIQDLLEMPTYVHQT